MELYVRPRISNVGKSIGAAADPIIWTSANIRPRRHASDAGRRFVHEFESRSASSRKPLFQKGKFTAEDAVMEPSRSVPVKMIASYSQEQGGDHF
jgi:hypothetical protein